MRRTTTLAAMAVFLVSQAALGAEPLTPAHAASRVGRKVTVEFKAQGIGSNPDGYEELYSEKSWENRACFFLRFPKATMANLAEKRITSLGYYQGDVVRATGVVKILDFGRMGKRAVIYIENLSQFEARSGKVSYTRTKAYKQAKVKGFAVLIHPTALEHKAELKEALKELETQLAGIIRVVPKKKLAALAKVRFWLEWDLRRPDKGEGAAQFHVSPLWLKEHNYNPDKTGDVELSNIRNFVAWSRQDQPWMVLHEMAHAHHHLILGADHAGALTAYKQAMDRKLYDSVKHVNGRKLKAYAATNVFEYYAELSEAFFGKNDFFPFNREELKKHDPVGYRLMRTTWGVK